MKLKHKPPHRGRLYTLLSAAIVFPWLIQILIENPDLFILWA